MDIREIKTEVTFHLKSAAVIEHGGVRITPVKVVQTTFAGMSDTAKERSFVVVSGPSNQRNPTNGSSTRTHKYDIYGTGARPISEAPRWLREMVGQ